MEAPLVNNLFFAILALLAPCIGLLFWLRSRKNLSLLSHSIVLSLLLLALSEPYWQHTAQGGSITALVDVSDSITTKRGQLLLDALEPFTAAGLAIQLRPFASRVASFNSDESSFSSMQRSFRSLGTDGTDLTAALNGVSGEEKVLLLTDGRPTKGGPVTAPGVKVFPIVPAETEVRKDLEITQLIAPLRAARDIEYPVRVTVRNYASQDASAILAVKANERVISREQITVKANMEKPFEFKVSSSTDAVEHITADLEVQGEVLTKEAYVSQTQRDTIILLSGGEEDARYLRQVLKDESFEVIDSVGQVKGELANQFDKAKVIILNNLPIELLGGEQRVRSLVNSVKQGVGLITIGGPKSYGLGGYRGSPLESALAVIPLPPKQKEKRLNVAVELVIDKSRSMADENRLEYAKEASREVIRTLKDDDYVGVIGFDTTPFEVVRLGLLRDIREQALERVGRLFPAARTNLFPSLEEARRRLEVAPASRKHMIVMTDGKIPDADETYKALVNSMRILGITLSTVLVSGESDFGFLEDLANIGGGTFYQTTNASNLPRIFLQDLRVRSGEQTLKEQQIYQVRNGPSPLMLTSINDFPTVRGYVETAPHRDTRVELVVDDGGEAKPLLASRTIGTGESIAFTSDANGRWSNEWIRWGDFRRFWFDLIQKAGKDSKGNLKYEIESSLEGGVQTFWLTTYGGTPASIPELTITDAQGVEKKYQMTREAKGRFSVSLAASPGKLTLTPKIDAKSYPSVTVAIDQSSLKEDTRSGFDLPMLHQLATRTGGVVNPDPKSLLGSEINTKQFLTRPLLLAAFLLYLASLLIRIFLLERVKRRKAV